MPMCFREFSGRERTKRQVCLALKREGLVEGTGVQREKKSPTEQIALPGELGQVNFLSSPESSPAGKLGTAQEPFLKTKSRN